MQTTTRIYLVRHGQVEGFNEIRYNGQSDVALTEVGLGHYHQLKERFSAKKISACYTSDLSRCRIGAEIICSPLGIIPTERRELRELNIGLWEGLTWQEIEKRWPEDWHARLADLVNYRVPQGENLIDLQARIMPLIKELVERHHGEEILLVGHGGINRIILLNAIAAPLTSMFNIEQSYGCLNIIDYKPSGVGTVKLLNG